MSVEVVRAVDYDIATGVWPDMTEHGWLGQKSSLCMRVIERLLGNSHLLNDSGQYAYYGRVGGCLVTGNEDGIKHCAMEILYSLGHLGFTIPPQADAAPRAGADGRGRRPA